MRRSIQLLALFTVIVAISQLPRWQVSPAAGAPAPVSGTQALQALNASSSSLAKLVHIQQQMVQISEKQANIYSQLNDKVSAWSKLIGQSASSSAQLMQATKNMQETQMSFNLQYLQLQNSMQNENRQFTMVSNIMKTKNDTVRNSISNIK